MPINSEIDLLAKALGGKAQLHFSDELPKIAIFVSKQNHCLIDLLWRVNSNEIRMNVPLIISNHSELEKECEQFNADFKFIAINHDKKFS